MIHLSHHAWILAEQKNFAAAERMLREILSANPQDVWAHSYLAYALTELRRWDEAIEQGRVAVGVDPEYGYAHFTLGRTLLTCDRPEEALVPGLECARLEPHIHRRHWLVAASLIELKLFTQALQSAESGLAVAKDSPAECLYVKAYALCHLNRCAEARAAMDAALMLNPGSNYLHCNDGYIRLLSNDAAGAVKSFGMALAIDPMNCHTHQGMGRALAQLGDLPGALTHFAEANGMNPYLQDARYGLTGLRLLRSAAGNGDGQ